MSGCAVCPLVEAAQENPRAGVAAALVLGASLTKNEDAFVACPDCKRVVEQFARAHNNVLDMRDARPS